MSTGLMYAGSETHLLWLRLLLLSWGLLILKCSGVVLQISQLRILLFLHPVTMEGHVARPTVDVSETSAPGALILS